MIQFDPSGQSALCQEAQLGYHELIELLSVSEGLPKTWCLLVAVDDAYLSGNELHGGRSVLETTECSVSTREEVFQSTARRTGQSTLFILLPAIPPRPITGGLDAGQRKELKVA